MRSAKDLFLELDYWIFIGTGDDIVRCPGQRPEYQHLVLKFDGKKVSANIPELVRASLYFEATRPLILQSTFWHLLKLSILKRLGR